MAVIAVAEPYLAGELPVGALGKELMLEKGDVPPGEVRGCHGQLARGKVPAFGLAAHRPRRTEGVARVCNGVIGLRRRPGACARHAERTEDVFLQERYKAHAGGLLENLTG